MPGVTPRAADYFLGTASPVHLSLLSANVANPRITWSSSSVDLVDWPLGHLPVLPTLGGALELAAIASGKQCILFWLRVNRLQGATSMSGRPRTAARHSVISYA